jgi:NADH-quinone oxidoreductase subunit H
VGGAQGRRPFPGPAGTEPVGAFGLIQPIADVIEALQEDITPAGANRVIFNIAPIMALATVLLMWAVIPFAPTILGADVNVAVLFIVAVGAMGTLGIIMAGWSSNNKYALLGAFRTVAQMVSYEVPMVIALLIPVILARSMGLQAIVEAKRLVCGRALIAALIFLTLRLLSWGALPLT